MNKSSPIKGPSFTSLTRNQGLAEMNLEDLSEKKIDSDSKESDQTIDDIEIENLEEELNLTQPDLAYIPCAAHNLQ